MSLFNQDQPQSNFLGVDIGGSSVKIVELGNAHGRAQLITYGYLERSLAGEGKRLLDDAESVAASLRRVADAAQVTTRNVVTALPSTSVFSTVINLPEIAKKDLSQVKKITAAVEYEAKKVLPLPIEEMILDWKVLGEAQLMLTEKDAGDQKIKNLQVLLTAASKSLVQKYIDIFKRADMNLLSLETESFALSRALVGKDKSVVVLIDIGASDTDIIMVDGMIPYLDRSVNVGGYQITKNFSTTLGITMEQAEQFKRDLAHYQGEIAPGAVLPPALEKMMTPVVNEMKYLFDFFLKQPGNEGKRIDRIVLSGGNSLIFNLPEFFTRMFDIRTFIGNPWARVVYPEDIAPLVDQLGTRFAVAVGLAMRDIEK